MTIKKGEPWGTPGKLADDAVLVHRDLDARRELEAAARQSRPPREFGLIAGDLARTVGASEGRNRLESEEAIRLPLDAMEVWLDGTNYWGIAHLVARSRFWHGPFTLAMNAEYLGEWRMAPASHPNDGRADLITGRLSISDRTKAQSRLKSGTHIPHPDISVRRVKSHRFELSGRVPVAIDGEVVGRPRVVEISMHPDFCVGVV